LKRMVCVCWHDRTSIERALIFCLFIMFTILSAVTFASYRIVQRTEGLIFHCSHKFMITEICTTAACVQASSNFLSSINTDIDPCDDFYEFACGTWNRDHPIPDDVPSFGTFGLVRNKVMQQMRGLLCSIHIPDLVPTLLC
jgi:hypothetical protein